MRSPELIAQDHLQFAIDNQDDCFSKSQVELYGVTEGEQFIKIATAETAYALLEVTYPCSGYIGIAVHSTGLAAPYDEDDPTPPSKRDDSRRVALITVVTEDGMGLAMAYTDEEIITDKGNAYGELAEALLGCWSRSKVA